MKEAAPIFPSVELNREAKQAQAAFMALEESGAWDHLYGVALVDAKQRDPQARIILDIFSENPRAVEELKKYNDDLKNAHVWLPEEDRAPLGPEKEYLRLNLRYDEHFNNSDVSYKALSVIALPTGKVSVQHLTSNNGHIFSTKPITEQAGAWKKTGGKFAPVIVEFRRNYPIIAPQSQGPNL